MMGNKKLSRRRLIQSGAAALLPLSAQLLRGVMAAESRVLPKLVFVYVPDGCVPDWWHPKGDERNFTLSPMTEPLESVKEELVFISGLDLAQGQAGHAEGIAQVLRANKPQSLDVLLGQTSDKQGPYASLHLGVATHYNNTTGTMSYDDQGETVRYMDNPVAAFDQLFPGSLPAQADGERLRQRKQSVLDNAHKEIEALLPLLGQNEKEKMQQNLDALREVELRIEQSPLGTCDTSHFNQQQFVVKPEDVDPRTWELNHKYAQVGQLQMEQALLALQCGQTDVVSLMWSHPESPVTILDGNVTLASHEASHYPTRESKAAIEWIFIKRWYTQQFARLIEKMKITPDINGGSLLQNSLVVLVSDVADSKEHSHENMPFILAGQAGGALETGRLLTYTNETHDKLLNSIASLRGSANAWADTETLPVLGNVFK